MAIYSSYTDQALAALLKEGDKTSFTEVFNRYHALLYAHAFNKLRNEEDADDVVQELFTKLWLKRTDLDAGNNLAGYLFRGLRNAIFDLIKHKRIVSTYEESFAGFVASNGVETDHLIREKQFAELIEREIAALPPRMREVFELRRKENLSNKEIAQRMEITESTVADQMKKALRILKARIGLALILISLAEAKAISQTPEKKYNFFLVPHPQSSFLNRNVYSCGLNTSHYDAERTVKTVN
jgi:RNA polymerase sigma-70 factor (ECF subfamily)